MAYSAEVIRRFNDLSNIGSFEDADNVGTGLVGAPACGDVLKLQFKVDENGVIIDAVFKAFGCTSAIASGSLTVDLLKGKSIDNALTVSNDQIFNTLKLPPVKKHCSVLAEEAIKVAVKNYYEKQAKHIPNNTNDGESTTISTIISDIA